MWRSERDGRGGTDERGRKEMRGRIRQLRGLFFFERKTTVQLFSPFFQPEQLTDSIFVFTVTATGRVRKKEKEGFFTSLHMLYTSWEDSGDGGGHGAS